MPQYLSPGVYVEEVEAGSRPIEGVGTAVAAFVGLAARGPANAPTLVTNWSQFTSTFGEFMENSYLAHAVYGYFNNDQFGYAVANAMRMRELLETLKEIDALVKRTTDELRQLLQANTVLTRQDKELTEQVATLTREIHAALAKPT